MWTIPAEDLLASGDLGLIPWVPLSRIDGPPEPILRRCRERIDQAAPESERENLLAVIQVLIGLRYDDERLFTIFGGEGSMIESPVLQRLLAKFERRGMTRGLTKILESRFGVLPDDVIASLAAIQDEATLDRLLDLATQCPDLEAFRAQVALPPSEPASPEEGAS